MSRIPSACTQHVLSRRPSPPPEDGTLDALASALPGGTSLRARVAGGAGAPAGADELLRWQGEMAASNPDVIFDALDDIEAEVGHRVAGA
jgi:hypothetical protein